MDTPDKAHPCFFVLLYTYIYIYIYIYGERERERTGNTNNMDIQRYIRTYIYIHIYIYIYVFISLLGKWSLHKPTASDRTKQPTPLYSLTDNGKPPKPFYFVEFPYF